MTPPTPVQPVNGLRLFRIILQFNGPLIILFVLFNVWRAFVHDGGAVCADFVCALTERHGGMLPIVSSFTEEALNRGATVNIDLARELLFFNVIFCIVYTIIATIAFCFAIPRLGLVGTIKYGKAALAILPLIAFLAFMIFIVGWSQYWPTPHARRGVMGRLIFDYWIGAFSYNGRSLVFSAFAMLLVFYLFNIAAYLRREFEASAQDRR